MIRTIFMLSFIPCLSYSQSAIELPVADQFDVVAIEWIEKTKFLKTYRGVNEYCQNPTFRKSVDQLLTTIHTYDSLIISKLDDPTSYLGWNTKEEKKTRSDIESFENEYYLKDFIAEMRDACLFRNDIEANADNLKNGVGYESYDAKVLVLETEVARYLNKIDRLILKIDDHLHKLKMDW
ncbi:MAG: hypothetical protein AAF600_15605 [Bacteroidota bacterium]